MSEAKELAARLRDTGEPYPQSAKEAAAALIERQAERIEALEAALSDYDAWSGDVHALLWRSAPAGTANAYGDMILKARALLAPAPEKETTT